jgi:hypothetical protein
VEVKSIDYTGAQGGMLAMAFAGGVTFATTILLAAGAFIWKVFGESRIKELQTAREQDNARCAAETKELRDRILQLETMLMLHGPQALRQAMQAVISEERVDRQAP